MEFIIDDMNGVGKLIEGESIDGFTKLNDCLIKVLMKVFLAFLVWRMKVYHYHKHRNRKNRHFKKFDIVTASLAS